MYKDLSHLSETEITTLMDRYYAGEKASVLVDDYQLSIPPSMLCKCFPPEPCANETCNYCGRQLVRTRLSNTARAEKITKRKCIVQFAIISHMTTLVNAKTASKLRTS